MKIAILLSCKRHSRRSEFYRLDFLFVNVTVTALSLLFFNPITVTVTGNGNEKKNCVVGRLSKRVSIGCSYLFHNFFSFHNLALIIIW